MNKWSHQQADGDLTPWEAELAQRLSSLRQLPTPPSLTDQATEGFMERLRMQSIKPVTPVRRLPAPALRLGMRFAAILLACVLGLSGVGYATATSLPGEPLYGLKRQVETAQLAASSSDQRAAFAEMLVDRRLQEMTQLIKQDAPETQVDTGVAEYAAAAMAFGQMSTISDKALLFHRHLEQLAALESVAPDQTRTALQLAQHAAQAQLANEKHAAPAPDLATPGAHLSQTPTSSPTMHPSATIIPVRPTISSPSTKEPTAQAPQQGVVSPTSTTEVLPSATPPSLRPTAAPKATQRPSPAITPTAAAKTAPVRRASAQPTHDLPPPPRPSAASNETQQPGDDHQQPPPTPQSPGDGHQQPPSTPQDPNNTHGPPPATPERTTEPHDPVSPPAQGTPASRSEQPSDAPEPTRETSTGHNPPPAQTSDKPQATRVKGGSGGSQQPPPRSGGTHPRQPGQGSKP